MYIQRGWGTTDHGWLADQGVWMTKTPPWTAEGAKFRDTSHTQSHLRSYLFILLDPAHK